MPALPPFDDRGDRPGRPAAVLLHDRCSSRADLRALGTALSATYRVVAPDAPAPTAAIPARADAVAALCDALGVRDALLVGHGTGAAVAVELAGRRPDLASAVVSLDGALLDASPAGDGAAALRGLAAPLLHVDASGTTDLDRLTALVPDVRLARAADAGHGRLVGRPAQAVAAIEDFVTATTGRRPVDNRAAVLALLDAVERGELDRIDDLVSPDFVDHGAPPGLVEPGPDGYRTVLGMLRSALDLRWEPLAVVAEGERVMSWVRNRGRHVGEFLGIPPTGAEFAFEAMHHFRVEDGVVREHHAVRDDLALLRALGVVPAGPPP